MCFYSFENLELHFYLVFFVHLRTCGAVTAATEINRISSEHIQHYENQQLDLWCPNGISKFKFLLPVYKMRIKRRGKVLYLQDIQTP